MIYPITFCIPEEKIVATVPSKTKTWGHVIPGRTETYIFKDEKSYYADYQQSFFGHTCKKAGWDCLRHYEILANGCIPWFTGLDACPPDTMTHFPKELVRQAMEIHAMDTASLSAAAAELLEYTRQHLTTRAMAQYVLDTTGHQDAIRILYLSQDVRPDYLRCLLLHGFKRLRGALCQDYPRIPHLYTNYSAAQADQLYGRGITYTRLLDPDKHDAEANKIVENEIAAHAYDLIIYGSIHRGQPFWDLVHRHYADKDVVLICGEDLHQCTYTRLANTHDLFIREM